MHRTLTLCLRLTNTLLRAYSLVLRTITLALRARRR